MNRGSLFLLLWVAAGCGRHVASSPSETSAWMLQPFVKASQSNPVLTPDPDPLFSCPLQGKPVRWEEKDVFNPAAVLRHDTVFLLYRAEDKVGRYAGTSRIGLAWSTDGMSFTRHPLPVLYPDVDAQQKWEWEGGCEDPRVVQDSAGLYYMTYTAYDGDKARLMVATSPDLYHWSKKGPAFADAYGGRYRDFWSKSGSIVSRYSGGTPVAARIGGKYWMYWGDQDIWTATSEDLIHWTPVTGTPDPDYVRTARGIARDHTELTPAIRPRAGFFDSDLVEPGPPAILTDAGILLLYNGRNSGSSGDPKRPEGTYSAGQALLDPAAPNRILKRSANDFLHPDQPFETEGQVNQVCFIEGLVRLHSRWLLYYGTADSRIAVAQREVGR